MTFFYVQLVLPYNPFHSGILHLLIFDDFIQFKNERSRTLRLRYILLKGMA